jgi:hypothetical protein
MDYRKPFVFSFALILGLFAATGALAWTGPTASPPGNNATAPLNTSATGQVKTGGLELNTGGAANGIIVHGNGLFGLNGKSAGAVGTLQLTSGGASPISNRLLFGTDGTGWKFSIGKNQGGTISDYLTIQDNGQVVIGSTVPYAGGARLTLETPNPAQWTQIVNYNNGSPSGQYGIYVYGSTYALYANGPVYGTAFYYLSDERAKKNIEAIASSTALQKILALEPVTYNWKDADKATTTQIGFIAQQVKRVVPELVLTDASTTQESVDYARVTPLLVGAAQAQQDRIDAMQREIDALTAEVRALKAGK